MYCVLLLLGHTRYQNIRYQVLSPARRAADAVFSMWRALRPVPEPLGGVPPSTHEHERQLTTTTTTTRQ
jgi:hypothetical protein